MGFVHRKAMTGVGFNIGVEVQHDELRFRGNGSLAEVGGDKKGGIVLPRNPLKNTKKNLKEKDYFFATDTHGITRTTA